MQSGSILSLSPSFGSYSSNKLAAIAARVVEELRAEAECEVDDTFGLVTGDSLVNIRQEKPNVEDEEKENGQDEDDDFEFTFACREPDSSPVSADEIFYNGRIRPLFPIVKTGMVTGEAGSESSVTSVPSSPSSIRLPLRKLLSEDRDPPSCSSSEADDLDGIQPGSYCVWTPKSAPEESPGRCKKSNSTGSSKRWKFRDFLHRSNSDGKNTFIFLAHSNSSAKTRDENSEKATAEASKDSVNPKPKTKVVASGEGATVQAVQEAHYQRNRATKEGERRRSFLPYKQDLVGLFANVNGMSRNLHPF